LVWRGRFPAAPVRLLDLIPHKKSPRDKVACERVPVIALLQSLAAERPELACSHLDVPDSVGEAVQAICDEVSSRSDFEVARRGNGRWVRRLTAVDAGTPGVGAAFGPEGFYLVTGATGGVGQVLCEHALSVAAHGFSQWDARRSRAVQNWLRPFTNSAPRRLAARRCVRRVAVRVYGAADVELSPTDGRGSLKGVVHLAGTYHDRMISDETLESLAEVWSAKIAGTRALQSVLADAPDAWFAGFSSAVSYFGGAMIGAYAAANRFIEAMAGAQAASGRRSLALGWSTWDQTGMSRGHAGGVALRARGFRDISPDQALHSFDAMFERRQGAVLVGLDRTNHFIRRQLAAGPIATSKVTAFVVTDRPAEVVVAAASRAVADRFGTPSTCDLAFLRALPKHADGKIDRAALTASSHTVERVAPRTEAERRVAEAWHEVMGGISPGVYDNFFEQGGHSLLATRVLARLKARWGIDLPLRAIFEAPTVEKLALKCTADGPQTGADSGAIVKSRSTTPPLSFAQQRLWFLDQLEPGQISYNIPCVFKLRGRLDIAALERSLTALVERHEALRTTFAVKEGQAVQQVGAAFPVTLARVDLTSLSRKQRDAAARAAALDEAQRPFDLAKGPLFRATLVTLDDQTFWLLITLHHIIADGWSLEILSRDLSALYQSFSQKRVPALAPLTIHYADYSQWQRDSLQGARLDRELAFWTTELAGVPTVLALPTDRPRPPIRSSRGRKYEFVLAPSLLAGIGPFTQGTPTTVFMALFAGFRAFLLAYTGQEDVAGGSPIAGRPQPELEPLIGFFANTLVLRTRAQARHSFRSILDEASRVSLDAFAHQDVPFEKLVEVLRVPRDRSRNPLFQVNFRVALTPVPPLKLPGIDVRPFELIDTATSKFDLALELSATEGGASYFEYSVDLFEDETVRLMRYDFERLLGAMLANPDRPLEQLDVFTEIAGRVRRAPAKKMTVSRRIRTGAQ
jgi:hypothetical protein